MTSIFEQWADRYSDKAIKAQAEAAWANNVAREYRDELARGIHDAHREHFIGRLVETEDLAATASATVRRYLDLIAAHGDQVEWDA